uniref:Chloroplast sabinene synthase n=1 Tax=Murraya koenigii TaxID=159030 RepID=A0A1U9M7Y9_MURKO|nr:chloroplast sabinene synthase [Murraya koenigii]
MALNLLSSLPATCNFTRLSLPLSSNVNGLVPPITRVQYRMAASTTTSTIKPADQTIIRRSADYRPTIWSFDYLQSLDSKYKGESYARQLEKLKEQVKAMLQQDYKAVDLDPLHQLELIDNLHRLGVSYHFKDEIKRTLDGIYNKNTNKSLYAAALKFRILRQHGYDIPVKETFSRFIDDKGSFKSSSHGDDCRGMLALYEAAYLLVEEESTIFRDSISFTTTYLKEWVGKHDSNKHGDEYLCTLVNHALELPLHWRMRRLEARWFIDVYESGPDMNPILLELAKLDFNIVQAVHQEDLKYVSRWWKKTGLGEKLTFSRDRVVENFLWTVGDIFEPQFGYCRRMSAMVNSLLTTIDDIYDVYGTLDELELFTDAVDRWDATATEQLPYYMKLCFHVLYNFVNEMAFDALRDQEVGMIIPYFKKTWADLCKAYFAEAKWYNSGYIPTFQEYMENAWISITAPLMLIHAYAFTANPITKEALEFLQDSPNIIRFSSMIVRLADDLGTSSDELKRGDVPKSIQCYMHETGISEDEAREHIRNLIAESWIKLNSARFGNPHYLSDVFIGIAMNMARVAQCIYQFGDGHGDEENTKDRVVTLFFDPIP